MTNSDPVDVFDVFTPTTQARLNFVERSELNDRFVDALRTPGKQLVIYGETGSGKSTLLTNKLEQLYEGHIVTRCQESMTFEQLLLDAFDQLAPFYEAGGRYTSEDSISSTLGADFRAIRGSIQLTSGDSAEVSNLRVLPPQLTPHRLGQFLGSRKLCWVIEDFHKVTKEAKAPLAQSLKVFCDLARDFSHVKIIALGATGTAREVIEYDREMNSRVAEVLVPLMTDAEIGAIIDGGESLLNVEFGRIKELIVAYSVGVASICHQLALNMCTNRGVYQTQGDTVRFEASDLQRALKKYIEDQSDTLKSRFDKALKRKQVRKFDNSRIILRKLAAAGPDGLLHGELLAEIRVEHPQYPAGNLANYLKALQTPERGSVLRSDQLGRYCFIDPFHQLYCHLTLSDGATTKGLSQRALLDALLSEIENEMNWYMTRPSSPSPRPRTIGRQLSLFRDPPMRRERETGLF